MSVSKYVLNKGLKIPLLQTYTGIFLHVINIIIIPSVLQAQEKTKTNYLRLAISNSGSYCILFCTKRILGSIMDITSYE